jgi:hypothetical protein
LLIAAVSSVGVPADGAPSPPSGAAGAPVAANPWLDKAQAEARVRDYLTRMKIDSPVETMTTEGNPMLAFTKTMKNATHQVRILVNPELKQVYIFLNRYLTAKPDSAALPQVLQRLMEENWNWNVGKFEWDKSDGEIRYSYCFTTENGVGFEAFEATMLTLLQRGDEMWPELRKLTGE